jgi:hypothetical protein
MPDEKIPSKRTTRLPWWIMAPHPPCIDTNIHIASGVAGTTRREPSRSWSIEPAGPPRNAILKKI